MRMTEYSAETNLKDADVLVIDGANGTRKITAKDLAIALSGKVSVEQRRNVYRGKKLGNAVTDAQKAAIINGTFDDIFVGDYWSIGGVNYRVADMDYFYNCGDTNFTKHHLVLVPDTTLYSAKMNDENITTGGYVGSKMYTEYLAAAKETIKAAFGDAVLTHRDYLINAVTDGHPSGGAWFDSEVELMNEIMVYGSHIYTPSGNGSMTVTRYTTGKQQFALFALNPKMVNRRSWYWLRDVVSSAAFAVVGTHGNSIYGSASYSNGVRPYFIIG